MQTVNRRIDQLAREIAELRGTVDRMPRLSGGVFAGVRGDNADGNYVDRDGRVNPLGKQEAVVHQFRLGVDSRLVGDSDATAALTSGNYLNFLGGNFAQLSPRPQGLNFAPVTGHFSNSFDSASGADTYLDRLEIRTPFQGLGRGSMLTIGRFNQRISRLTLWRPDVDSYFNVPWEDGGYYRLDGARVNTALGSLSLEAFGGRTKSVRGTTGISYNSPLAGTGLEPTGTQVFPFSAKPNGQPELGQMTVNQLAGISLGLGLRQLEGGHLRLSALELAGSGGAGFNGVHALGADVSLRLSDRLSVMGDRGKTITHTGRTDTVNPRFNNAFNAAVRYDAGSLNLSAGYRYVDPHFYAPGYWGRIGAWLNPTNIAGPSVRAAWDISPRFAINVGGELFSAARDRGMSGGLSENDTITRALVGIRWNLSQSLETTIDWEGVYWQLEGAHSNLGGRPSLITPGGFRLHPTEHYITLGTGYSLTNTAKLRLLYQFGMYDGHGFLLNAPGVGPRNTFNIFTGQVAVKF
jgi:hypothetical protein